MKRRLCGLPALLALACCTGSMSAQVPPSTSGATSPAPASRPTLVVLITVDQLRADYLTRFGPQLNGGVGRLMRGGAWFTDANHDHAITETAPGHATLLSGRFPRSTGIMMNRIGVEDDAAPLLGGATGQGASPRRFVGTTLVDWLRTADARSRSLSVSMKDRGAILPVGRSRTSVYWYSPDGRFTTSRFYADSLPAWVNAFNARRLPQGYASKSWTLLLPDTAYPENDDKLVQLGVATFPHTLPSDTTGAANMVRITPFMDDITSAFALQGLTTLGLGTGPQTDLLAMSLSATDVIGHRYGPDSREIHDDVLRLDRTVGAFLDSLYRVRDSSRVVVALTSDHGVAPIPELATNGDGAPPERVDLSPVIAALRAGLRAAKVDTMAIDLDQQIVFVDRAAFRAASVNADSAIAAFAASLRNEPGVRRVDQFRTLVEDSLKDPIARRWSHQFPITAPVELVVTLTPMSTWGGNVASHGSPYDYDSHVPMIFYGAGVRRGRYDAFVRTVDLAPTLAALAGVKPTERVDGVVLGDALLQKSH
ncbi:MAG: alkaline phosphatase family protein [Gemmatimonadaceae bacterium]